MKNVNFVLNVHCGFHMFFLALLATPLCHFTSVLIFPLLHSPSECVRAREMERESVFVFPLQLHSSFSFFTHTHRAHTHTCTWGSWKLTRRRFINFIQLTIASNSATPKHYKISLYLSTIVCR